MLRLTDGHVEGDQNDEIDHVDVHPAWLALLCTSGDEPSASHAIR
jgi:hypothetical protein